MEVDEVDYTKDLLEGIPIWAVMPPQHAETIAKPRLEIRWVGFLHLPPFLRAFLLSIKIQSLR